MKNLIGIILVFIPWLCSAQKIGSQLLGKWTMTEYGTDMTGYQDSIAFVNDTSVFKLELIIRNNELEFNRSQSRFNFKDSLTLKWLIRQTDDMVRDSSLSIEGANLVLYKKKEKKPEYLYFINKINSYELVLSEINYNATYGSYSEMFYKFERTDYNNHSNITTLYGSWNVPNHDLDSIQYYDTLILRKDFDCPEGCKILGLNFDHNDYEPDVFKFTQQNWSKYDGVYIQGSEAHWIYNPLENIIMLIYSQGYTKIYKILSINENEVIITNTNKG